MGALRTRRVLVVDDSAVSRRLLSRAILSGSDLEVVAEAPDAFSAHALIAQHQPDLITLDLEMPQMDGLAFLRHLMANSPRPVIVVSSHTPSGSARSLEALRVGAADVILKPAGPASFNDFAQELTRRIREAAGYRVQRVPFTAIAAHQPVSAPGAAPLDGLIVVGASTGGPQALETLLSNLPTNLPPIVVVQHMPTGFTRLLAKHLDDACPMRVVEGQHADQLARGCVYIAPGGRHVTIEPNAAGLRIALTQRQPVHYQRPSVDVLFHSAAALEGIRIVGVLLTGMGEDGADGMAALAKAGHQTIAQDERTSLIFGMPRAAIDRGAARRVISLEHMPAVLMDCLRAEGNSLRTVGTAGVR
jgi:two-component system chemotaxis response regulator CheB